MIVANKSEMQTHLADAMRSSFERFREDQNLERDTGLLKSYLVEAHAICGGASVHDDILSFMRGMEEEARIVVTESEDETLYNIVHGNDTYYVDT